LLNFWDLAPGLEFGDKRLADAGFTRGISLPEPARRAQLAEPVR